MGNQLVSSTRKFKAGKSLIKFESFGSESEEILGFLGFEIESLGESSVNRLSGTRLELVHFSPQKQSVFF
jgi:hypothetical protein